MVYQDLYPIADEPQTTWILPHPVIGSLPYVQLPPAVPPVDTTDQQPTTSGAAVLVSPTTHVEAPDDITTSDDEWDPHDDDSSSEEDVDPNSRPISLTELRLRATEIRILKRERQE
jgi:hypothetical protein